MAKHEMYVVTSNLPGPGASALLMETAHAMIDADQPVGKLLALRVAVDRACEFVELEDADGNAAGGRARGIDWASHLPGHGSLQRLGPFFAVQQVQVALGRLYGCLFDPGDGEQLPAPARQELADGFPLSEILEPSDLIETWANCMDIAADGLHVDAEDGDVADERTSAMETRFAVLAGEIDIALEEAIAGTGDPGVAGGLGKARLIVRERMGGGPDA